MTGATSLSLSTTRPFAGRRDRSVRRLCVGGLVAWTAEWPLLCVCSGHSSVREHAANDDIVDDDDDDVALSPKRFNFWPLARKNVWILRCHKQTKRSLNLFLSNRAQMGCCRASAIAVLCVCECVCMCVFECVSERENRARHVTCGLSLSLASRLTIGDRQSHHWRCLTCVYSSASVLVVARVAIVVGRRIGQAFFFRAFFYWKRRRRRGALLTDIARCALFLASACFLSAKHRWLKHAQSSHISSSIAKSLLPASSCSLSRSPSSTTWPSTCRFHCRFHCNKVKRSARRAAWWMSSHRSFHR